MLHFACAWRHINQQALFCILLGRCRVRQRRKTRMQNRAFSLEYNMEEVWKDIPGYEGRYQVSSQGRVRSFVGGKCGALLRPGRMPRGHMSVALGRGNSQCVHKLVLLTFIGPAPEKHECRHLNGVPSDNRLENLRWGTRGENIKDDFLHGVRTVERCKVWLDKGRAARWGKK